MNYGTAAAAASASAEEEYVRTPRSLLDSGSITSPGHHDDSRLGRESPIATEVSLHEDVHEEAEPSELPNIRNKPMGTRASFANEPLPSGVVAANLQALSKNLEMQPIDKISSSPVPTVSEPNRPSQASQVSYADRVPTPVKTFSPPLSSPSSRKERSPAPLPAINPVTSPPMSSSPLRQSLSSPTPAGTEPIDANTFQILSLGSDMDITGDGQPGKDYERNKLATGIVAVLVALMGQSLLEHLWVMNWIVRFNGWNLIVAALCYMVSALFIVGTLASTLIYPAYSLSSDLPQLYSLFLVAGVVSLIGVLMGGSVFGVVTIYALDYEWIDTMTGISATMSVAIAGALYFVFTRPNGTVIGELVHPFRAKPLRNASLTLV